MNDKKIIEKAIELLYAGSFEPNEKIPFILSHTFTNTTTVCVLGKDGKPEMLVLDSEENQQKWLSHMKKLLTDLGNFDSISALVNKPYRMYFLKICKPYMTNAEFSERLAENWVMTENPNNDVNVPLKEAGKFFEEADKEALMENEELEVFNSLPDEFDVYRGVSVGRKKMGFSWTRDLDKARWFANRFGEGYIIKAHVRKEQILAYFSRRGEDEYVVNSFKLKTTEIVE